MPSMHPTQCNSATLLALLISKNSTEIEVVSGVLLAQFYSSVSPLTGRTPSTVQLPGPHRVSGRLWQICRRMSSSVRASINWALARSSSIAGVASRYASLHNRYTSCASSRRLSSLRPTLLLSFTRFSSVW